MNIILIVFDTLRKDSVGVYGETPWARVETPVLDALASESVRYTHAYPESLPTLPARRALYTGRRTYPFNDGDVRLKGDFVGAPGWGPIPEDQPTLAERLGEAGYRTGLISDLYHQFKPSKNFWRGYHEWNFLRGQEMDPTRSGPEPTEAELDAIVPAPARKGRFDEFVRQVALNMRGRHLEEDHCGPRVLADAMRWLEENRDATRFFLTVESFDPHEPWIVPEHYASRYGDTSGPNWAISTYDDVARMEPHLLARARANYAGLVTMCDNWLGRFLDRARELDVLDSSLLVVVSDHGHSIGERGYMGKRGYPSEPEVVDIPMFVRYPRGEGGGTVDGQFVQHVDVTATILEAAGLRPGDIDGRSFLHASRTGREHVTVGWGSTPTVITEDWWLNCKVDGTGVLLHDLRADDPFAENIAPSRPDVVADLFERAVADAGGDFSDWLLGLAKRQADAPGCSAVAARR